MTLPLTGLNENPVDVTLYLNFLSLSSLLVGNIYLKSNKTLLTLMWKATQYLLRICFIFTAALDQLSSLFWL